MSSPEDPETNPTPPTEPLARSQRPYAGFGLSVPGDEDDVAPRTAALPTTPMPSAAPSAAGTQGNGAWPGQPGAPGQPGGPHGAYGAYPYGRTLDPGRRGASGVARFFSVVLAVLGTALGLLMFCGAVQIGAQDLVRGDAASGTFTLALAVGGLVVLVLSAFTSAMSGAGIGVVGVILTVAGAAGLVPVTQGGITIPLAVRSYQYFHPGSLLGDQAYWLSVTGTLLAGGLLLLFVSLLERFRPRHASVAGGVLWGILGTILGLAAWGALAPASARLTTEISRMSGGVLTWLMAVAGLTVLLGLMGLSARWTSVPLVIIGLVGCVVAVWILTDPAGVISLLAKLGSARIVAQNISPVLVPELGICAALALGAGVGTWVRSRRKAAMPL